MKIMFNLFKGQSANTETVIAEPKRYKDIRAQWKALAADRKITKEDIAALCIYRAMVKDQVPELAISKLQKSFKPITNQTKLINGAAPFAAREYAMNAIKYSKFSEWLDADEMKALLEAAKNTKAVLK
jgi:cellulase/cellobiase CelA1